MLDGSICLYPTVERRKNTIFKYFRLSLKPILQLLSLFLASRFVELLGARTHLSLYHANHQSLLLLPACIDIQPNAPCVLHDHFYDNRNLLTEDYIRLIRMVTKVQNSAFRLCFVNY